MLKIVCSLLVLLMLLPAIIYSCTRIKKARRRKAALALKAQKSTSGPIVTAGELPPSESGKWRVEPIMQILREAKAKKEQSTLTEEPIETPVEPGA